MRLMFVSCFLWRKKNSNWNAKNEKLYIWFRYEWFVFVLPSQWKMRKKPTTQNCTTHIHTQKNCLAWMKKVMFSIHGVCQVLITYIFHSRQNPKTAFRFIVIARCDLTTGVVRCHIPLLRFDVVFFSFVNFFLLSLGIFKQ